MVEVGLYEIIAFLVTLGLGYLVARWQYQTIKKKLGLAANIAFPATGALIKTVNDALADDIITPEEARAIADNAKATYDAWHMVLHDP